MEQIDVKNEAFDIVIQAGQSNAAGCGRGAVDNEFIPDDRILCMRAEQTVTVTPKKIEVTYADKDFIFERMEEQTENGEKIADMSPEFCRKYIAGGSLGQGRKLLVIKAAVGGTGFAKGNWGAKDDLYLKMLQMASYALSLSPKNKVVAVLWHQGEHDAFENADWDAKVRYATHYNNLSLLVKGIRAACCDPDLPFIAAGFVDEWYEKNLAACDAVLSAIRDCLKDAGSSGFVESKGLLSNNQKVGNGDDIHFCREAQYTLGGKYYDEYKRIVR